MDDRRNISAQASFDLDLRELGVAAPPVLTVETGHVLRVQVSLFAVGAGNK